MSALLTKRQYQTLLTDLRRIIREGKEEAERAAAASFACNSRASIPSASTKRHAAAPAGLCSAPRLSGTARSATAGT